IPSHDYHTVRKHQRRLVQLSKTRNTPTRSSRVRSIRAIVHRGRARTGQRNHDRRRSPSGLRADAWSIDEIGINKMHTVRVPLLQEIDLSLVAAGKLVAVTAPADRSGTRRRKSGPTGRLAGLL